MTKKLIIVGVAIVSVIAILLYVQQNTVQNRASERVPQSNGSRGYLVSVSQLNTIREQAERGVEPYKSNVNNFRSKVLKPSNWQHGTIGGPIQASKQGDQGICDGSQNGPEYVSNMSGGRDIYSMALAYHLFQDDSYAAFIRERILNLTDTTEWGKDSYGGENQCLLTLSFSIGLWIAAADLIEGYPAWTQTDKQRFQKWLVDEVYHKTAWASRERKNNWGAAGSGSSAMIADYLWDYNGTLFEEKPQRKTLTAAQAYAEHNQMQIMRMNTSWKGDSKCDQFGIREHGGFPDELRRGTTGCNGTYLLTKDSAYTYQMTIVDDFLRHAEFLLHRGDTSIYDNLMSSGAGSLLNAIHFVIDNPTKSYEWDSNRKGTLYVAYRYYRDSQIKEQLFINESSNYSSVVIPWGKLTHSLGTNENPALPPVVAPPGSAVVTNEPTIIVSRVPTITGIPSVLIPTVDVNPTITSPPIITEIPPSIPPTISVPPVSVTVQQPTTVVIPETLTPVQDPSITPETVITQEIDTCALKVKGDANCDETIDLIDFEILRGEFLDQNITARADFNGDGTVSLLDVQIWTVNFPIN